MVLWLTRAICVGSPMRPLNRIGASSSRSWAWTSRRASLPPPECRGCAARPAVSWKRSRIPPFAKAIGALSASVSCAGGLASHLRPGDWVVASSIREAQTVRATDAVWSRKLLGLVDGAIHAPILGVDSPIAEPAKKRELYRTTGAAVVDMESHVVARVAARHDLAFAALRVVVDPAHRTVPPAALLDMRPDGRPNVPAMLRNIAARPSQLSRLARIAVDAFTARAAMNRVRHSIGPHFGLMDL